MSTPSKLRILCLHGMVQNGTIFRKKTAVLRKKLDKIADLGESTGPLRRGESESTQCQHCLLFTTVYVTGPHLITDPKYTSEAAREAAADPNASEGNNTLG